MQIHTRKTYVWFVFVCIMWRILCAYRMYLHVFCAYLVHICMYLLCICIYLHVSVRIHTRYITDTAAIKQCISANFFLLYLNVSVCICCICMYLYVSICISMYLPNVHTPFDNKSLIHSYQCAAAAISAFEWSIHSTWLVASMRRRRWVVRGPDHGPRVDVVQLAAWSWPSFSVAAAPWKAGVFLGHAAGMVPKSPAGSRGSRPMMCERGAIYMTGSVDGIYSSLVPISAVLGHQTLPSLGQ